MFSAFKSFVHSITTPDHYASYDPNRSSEGSGQDQPLTTDYPSYPRTSLSSRNSSTANLSYTQGSRSQQLNSPRESSLNLSSQGSSAGNNTAGSQINLEDIQTQKKRPVPSPAVSWERIDQWVDQNYPELYDQLQDGCTAADLRELEHDLDCHLPVEVHDSFKEHDGQERGGKPTGLLFGITLLDMNSVTDEWTVWRNTAVRLNSLQGAQAAHNRQGLAERQKSCPPEAIQAVYAHPGWIPLAKDFNGNNVGIDLAPGPRGSVGQVILFGRDFDMKYVIAPSWAHFLDMFATDLESGQSFIDDDIEEAVFAYKLPSGRLASYLEILRSRSARALRQAPGTRRNGPHSSSDELVMKLTPAKLEAQMNDVKISKPESEPEPEVAPEAVKLVDANTDENSKPTEDSNQPSEPQEQLEEQLDSAAVATDTEVETNKEAAEATEKDTSEPAPAKSQNKNSKKKNKKH